MNVEDPYKMENNKEEKLNQFNSNSNSNPRVSTQNNPNPNNFRSIRSLKNNLAAFNNPENARENNIIEENADNLREEMWQYPYADVNQNLNVHNYEYGENYEGADNNNFVQNLSEYNQSLYNSIKPGEMKNRIQGQAGNQFAKTIVHLDDEEKQRQNIQMRYVNEDNLNVNNFNVHHGQNRKINLNQKSNNSYETNNLVMFFFINPESGTQTGLNILNMGVKKVEFNDPHGMVFIYNMKDPAILQIGIQSLIAEFEKVSLIKIIVGGGDSSIIELVNILDANRIDFKRCHFGVLPLGLTNDLSAALRWGRTHDGSSDMAKFKVIVKDLFEAASITIDIWEIVVRVEEENGEIIEMKNGKKISLSESRDGQNKKCFELRKNFINYFSLGMDARIGYGAKKHKSKYRCCNFLSLLWESCKKKCFRKTMKLNEIIDSFMVMNKEDIGNIMEESVDNLNTTVCENMSNRNFLFKTLDKNKIMLNPPNTNDPGDVHVFWEENKSNENLQKMNFDCKNIILKGNPVSLVAQNINTFNGKENLWKNAGEKFGLEAYEERMKEKNYKKDAVLKIKEDMFFKEVFKNAEQKFDDKKLEFFSFDSEWKIGNPSNTYKLYQGNGPCVINFKDTPAKVASDKFNRVYLNIDGEYYHIVKPREIRVRSAKKINEGKLKFLQKS